MNEKTVFKHSILTFVIGLVIFSLISIFTKNFTYTLGFLLGYVFNTLVFYVIIFTSNVILAMKKAVIMVVLMNLLKLLIYAVGFILAIFFPKVFNIIGVFFGYMVIKITIYVESYFKRR